tara:strand:+ start:10198 stop:10698 length:501 start_codon:yes stop_codon:yes gene_type:complete
LANLIDSAVITGGIGKDSGNLTEQGYRSEADFLMQKIKLDALTRHYKIPAIYLDELATNGGENARNSISLLTSNELPSDVLTAVAHATSARRLGEMLKNEGIIINKDATPTVFIKPTSYNFDPTDPLDQAEARAELLRLADWPAKDWLPPQNDLPEELVEFARDKQ